MGRSNRFVDMNEVYTHIKTTCKEQLAIRLWHMSSGPNGCHRQPRPQLVEVEGKFNAKPWQYKDDQFQALEDQLETSPTRISNSRGHKGNGSRNPCTERRTQGRQYLVQALTNKRVSRFELKIPNFQGDHQLPKEFLD
jgi:hypothetical protein